MPGLCLSTGRHAEAATILRSFARFVRDGLLPNDFPDRAEDVPQYHTIDASLWYPIAVRAHAVATGSDALLDELLPTLQSILDAHIAGTRFGIGMDPADGLLRGGAEGYQLTWMDARVDGWVVTPRRGKPVEIQALWVNALRIVGERLTALGDDAGSAAGARYLAIATQAETSFRSRFWDTERGYLLDVVDGPDGDDPSLRPNQLLAVSLPHPLIDGEAASRVVAAVRDELAVPLGLRSLAPSDPAYRPHYQGDRRFRDAGYHQGTVWTWLVGAYAEATARVTGRPRGRTGHPSAVRGAIYRRAASDRSRRSWSRSHRSNRAAARSRPGASRRSCASGANSAATDQPRIRVRPPTHRVITQLIPPITARNSSPPSQAA